MPSTFASQLLDWFDQHGRHDLPWQQDINPYRVWLSEIMLQQTQVKTVIPYFERFIAAFPSVAELAAAPIDKVLHLWTGLGYYARARNLHKTAQLVVDDYAGQFPNATDNLETLPGIGRSTAGAICAIAFQQRAAILDGNVKRVLARYYTIEGWPGKNAVQKQLWALAETNTPDDRCAEYTQAIMDLGATLCTRSKPNCQACPLQADCQAHASATMEIYPTKKPKKTLPIRSTHFLIISDSENRILLQQRPPVGLWGGLWCFPQCEHESAIHETCEQIGIDFKAPNSAAEHDYRFDKAKRHTFSHFHLDYTPVFISLSQLKAELTTQIAEHSVTWVRPQDPGQLGLPRPVEQVLNNIPISE
ncbi:MAG: A/G-specific adenine glycosylase [Porticoccaceae bacterium]|nr:A/G-specific adenine glycosylase [Porticoccaceae bacterium]